MCNIYYRGVVPSLGHDRVATEDAILGALKLGEPSRPLHITHLFNVCSFHHRSVSAKVTAMFKLYMCFFLFCTSKAFVLTGKKTAWF